MLAIFPKVEYPLLFPFVPFLSPPFVSLSPLCFPLCFPFFFCLRFGHVYPLVTQ